MSTSCPVAKGLCLPGAGLVTLQRCAWCGACLLRCCQQMMEPTCLLQAVQVRPHCPAMAKGSTALGPQLCVKHGALSAGAKRSPAHKKHVWPCITSAVTACPELFYERLINMHPPSALSSRVPAGSSGAAAVSEMAAGLLMRVVAHSRFASALARCDAPLPSAAARLQAPLESLLPVVEDNCCAQRVRAAHKGFVGRPEGLCALQCCPAAARCRHP